MADSDHKLCAALAKWMGWERRPPGHLWGVDPTGQWVSQCPAYDTNPADALALLDWLAGKGWQVVIACNCARRELTHVSISHALAWRPVYQAQVPGPPSVALPRAIFEAACGMIEAEKESEVSDG